MELQMRQRNSYPVIPTFELAIAWEEDSDETTATWTPSPELLKHASQPPPPPAQTQESK